MYMQWNKKQEAQVCTGRPCLTIKGPMKLTKVNYFMIVLPSPVIQCVILTLTLISTGTGSPVMNW